MITVIAIIFILAFLYLCVYALLKAGDSEKDV